MFKDWTYEEAIKEAEHIRALGLQNDIYLEVEDFPFQLATDCEAGGTHRIEISTSVWFYAFEPKTGLKFRCSFDIEPPSANGKGHYEIDIEAIKAILKKLNGNAKVKFREYLADCSTKIYQQGTKYQGYADRQFKDSAILRDLVKTK